MIEMNFFEVSIVVILVIIGLLVVYKIISYTHQQDEVDNTPGSIQQQQYDTITNIIHLRNLDLKEWIAMCKRIFEPKRRIEFGLDVPITELEDLSEIEARNLIKCYSLPGKIETKVKA